MKISSKILITVCILVATIAISSLYSYAQFNKVGQELVSISQHDMPLLEITTKIEINQLEQAINFERALRYAENNEWENYKIAKENFQHFAELADEELIQGINIAEQGKMAARNQIEKEEFEMASTILQQINDRHTNYEDSVYEIFSLIDAGDLNEALRLSNILEPLQDELDSSLESLLLEIERFTKAASIQAEKDEQAGLTGLLIGSIVIIALAVSSFFIIRKIFSPIEKLRNATASVSQGKYDVKLATSGNDEIAFLAKDFKKMVESLKQSKLIVNEIQNELQEQLKKLKELDVRKEEFSSMITHELKTPLTPITGHCEMLEEPNLLGELNAEQLKSVKVIERNAARLERLISDILDAQKLDMGKMEFNKVSFQIDKFMKNVENDLSPLMKDKEIEFVNQNSIKTTMISDETRLRQVMDNLVKNAVDFVPEKTGRIEMGSELKDSRIVFHVKDNGIGIPTDKQQNLFKKFYQIDTSYKRKHGGTGLGLVVCKGIVEGLGGKIWVESDEGKGTTFYFSIPTRQENIAREP